jgi:DNA phosphorothioation-associated putative methyltransferase
MNFELEEFKAIARACQQSRVGKHLPGALYVHTSALPSLEPLLQDYENRARTIPEEIQGFTLIKFSTDRPKISYLFYPEFDREPHPSLQYSILVDLSTLRVNSRDYRQSDNPPILHRKETFLTPDYPLYGEFAQLTDFESQLGLLDHARLVGARREWEQRLNFHHIAFEGHRLICPLKPRSHNQILQIERHRAAIVRSGISRPIALALEAGLLKENSTFFDYGCGHGVDVEKLTQQGYQSSGWDPYYHPNNPIIPADIVNLGYVINVIENLAERRETLLKAWEVTGEILIVSAQVLINDSNRGLVPYSDGIVTSRKTFQKYYEQEELKNYIDQVLNVNSVPAGLGIYFVFREESEAEKFRASRFHSRAATPRVLKTVKRFADYQELLQPLMNFVTKRGRLPAQGELPGDEKLRGEFGSIRKAFKIILQATDEEEWEKIVEKRREELLLYLALSSFSHRPKLRELSSELREDVKAIFGNYNNGCLVADLMLASLNDLANLGDLAKESVVGKKYHHSLLIHVSALSHLPTLLRLYEGCASRTFGRFADTNVIQFYFNHPKITYSYYPEFDQEPHPILASRMEVSLRNLKVRYYDFRDEDNPPILHEKDLLVTPDYPDYQKFARLSQQEREWGLLDDFSDISNRQGWLKRLDDRCATFDPKNKYRLLWKKDADPYKIKLLRSEIQSRKKQEKLLINHEQSRGES